MKSIFTIILICAAAFSACTENGPAGDGTGYDGRYSIQIPDSANGKETWLPGDSFVIHGEYSSDQVSVTLEASDISKDGKTCFVNVSGVSPYEQKAMKSVYYIAYPGEMVVNARKCRDMSGFDGTNAYLMAGYNSDRTFVLETVVGGFSFTVSGDYDSYDVRGNNDEVLGYGSLTSRITPGAKIYMHDKDEAKVTITGAVVSDGNTVNYICMPGDFDLPDGFLMNFYKAGKPVKTFYTEKPYQVRRNVFASIGDLTASLIEYKAPAADTHQSAIPTEGAVNLSAAETANCYMVTEPGIYSFKAMKGNSAESLASIGSVEVLWETWGTTESVVPNSVVAQVDYEKDVVYFRIAEDFHPGNAVIGARNDMGALMWSWHIWVPETPLDENLFGLSRRMSQDRNLGALVVASKEGASEKSAGLLYQWGRKDPFPGVGDFETGKSATVAGREMSLAGGQMTMAKTLKNPTVFADYAGHWNPSMSEDYWAGDKTKYDPCPPGYRIPYRSEHLLFNNSPADMNGWMFSDECNVFTAGNPAAAYPLGGYLSCDGTYADYGTHACIWSSRTHSTAGLAYNFRVGGSSDDVSYGNGGKEKANGYAVRCVRYDSVPFENAEGTPVMGKNQKFTAEIRELSGLCLHTDGSFLWGVGDQGMLAKISFDGNVEKVFSQGLDMEGITIDPATNDLYLGLEPNHVYKVEAPEYTKAVKHFDVEEAAGYGNSGVEGISWYKDGMILVGTQTGAYLWAYTLDGTVVWKKSMRTVAIGMQEIADIHYDPVKDQIWIIDSETQSIYLFNGNADEHLATYRVAYGGNCESVYVDYGNSCVWIADDSDSSVLYKIGFTF